MWCHSDTTVYRGWPRMWLMLLGRNCQANSELQVDQTMWHKICCHHWRMKSIDNTTDERMAVNVIDAAGQKSRTASRSKNLSHNLLPSLFSLLHPIGIVVVTHQERTIQRRVERGKGDDHQNLHQKWHAGCCSWHHSQLVESGKDCPTMYHIIHTTFKSLCESTSAVMD